MDSFNISISYIYSSYLGGIKMKSIKFSDYIKINSTKSELTYYKIIPHQSTRNYKSIEIAQVINRCYIDISKRINKIDKNLLSIAINNRK